MTPLIEVSPNYAAAVHKLDSLQAKASELQQALDELYQCRASGNTEPQSAALLAADVDLDAVLEDSQGVAVDAQIESLERKNSLVKGAIPEARRIVESERAKALKMLGVTIRPDYLKVVRRQALALIELTEAAQAYNDFVNSLPGTLGECGLDQTGLTPLLGNQPKETPRIKTAIEVALNMGAITAKDVKAFAA